MDVKVVRANPGNKKGKLNVRLQVTTHGRPTETVDVTVDAPRKYVLNQSALVKAKDGTWRSPLQVIEGKWRFAPNPSIEWEEAPLTDEEVVSLANPNLRDFHHRNIVDHCRELGFPEYTLEGVRVVPKGVVHIDKIHGTGMVQVEVEAFDALTGRRLNVGDGWFQFDRMPTRDQTGKEHPRDSLRWQLAQVIKRLNQ